MDLPNAVKQYGPDLGRYVFQGNGLDVLRSYLRADGISRSQEVVAAVFTHARALELADFLEGKPLREAEALTAPLLDAVTKAGAKVRQLEEDHASAMVAYWKKPKGSPPQESGELKAARAALTEAQHAARYPAYEVQMLKDKIEYLRTQTAPDPGDLAALSVALKGV
jgi:hypothetical protein